MNPDKIKIEIIIIGVLVLTVAVGFFLTPFGQETVTAWIK